MFDIFVMDMGGHTDNVQSLVQRFPHARVVRYYDNHLDTVKRCVAHSRTPYCWVIASCCDYATFDFDYRVRPWEARQMHCWASGNQKFGDTFLINVREFNRQQDIELLEWYQDINWHEQGVPRLEYPCKEYATDNLVNTVKSLTFTAPYTLVKRVCDATPDFDPPLWRNRAVYTFNRANSVSLVPREISAHLRTQIYDYPFISKQKTEFFNENLLDIVYISNGEPNADLWYDRLQQLCGDRAKRIDGVDGRSNAYKAAARASGTDWFFAVFAKLEVVENFDWQWQPDYLQEPKHYIFHSRNPVTKLEYGHMGIIAYNRRLVLETDTPGLDFTLSKPHAVVPMLSAIAHYNTTPELTWRTAFREALKLQHDVTTNGSVESRYRLTVWLGQAEGNNAEWSLLGARDAVDYYNTVKGDYDQLMLSFEWQWLRDRWASQYNQ